MNHHKTFQSIDRSIGQSITSFPPNLHLSSTEIKTFQSSISIYPHPYIISIHPSNPLFDFPPPY